jgi:hypothetical protein
MAAMVSRDRFDALAAKYGWQYDAKAGTVTVESTAHPITWTQRGHIPPRSPLWRVMRTTAAFARDFPLKAARKQAGPASSPPPASATDPAVLVQSPDFWAGLSPADIEQARQAMDRGGKLARERAAEKLREQYAELRQQAEALGLTLPPLK